MYDQYELIAAEYAETLVDDFDARPFDRRLVESFADLVRQSGGSDALDVGCGPGPAAAELSRCLNAQGIDGSAAMVSIAQQRYPQIRFRVADMFALPFPDRTFDAVCAWYSIIHTPTDRLPQLFEGFSRVLTDPGWLLLAFQTDAPPSVYDEAFGRQVDMTFLRHDTSAVCDALHTAGFTVYATARRERQEQLNEITAQAFVIAHRTAYQVG
ncbi:class I SAM-dependent methyltransferase [Mycolicibacterium sp. XJ870]